MESSNLYFSAAAVSYGATIESTDVDTKGRVHFELDSCPKEAWIIRDGEVKKEKARLPAGQAKTKVTKEPKVAAKTKENEKDK